MAKIPESERLSRKALIDERLSRDPLNSGQEILDHLGARLKRNGSLNVHPTKAPHGGDLMIAYYRLRRDVEIYAPGAAMPPEHDREDADAHRWRVKDVHEPDSRHLRTLDLGGCAVALADIVTVLPGEVAEWAVQTHEKLANNTLARIGKQVVKGADQPIIVPDTVHAFFADLDQAYTAMAQPLGS